MTGELSRRGKWDGSEDPWDVGWFGNDEVDQTLLETPCSHSAEERAGQA